MKKGEPKVGWESIPVDGKWTANGVTFGRREVHSLWQQLDGLSGAVIDGAVCAFGRDAVVALPGIAPVITDRYMRAVDRILRMLRKAGLAEPCRDTSNGKSTPTWRQTA